MEAGRRVVCLGVWGGGLTGEGLEFFFSSENLGFYGVFLGVWEVFFFFFFFRELGSVIGSLFSANLCQHVFFKNIVLVFQRLKHIRHNILKEQSLIQGDKFAGVKHGLFSDDPELSAELPETLAG